MEDARALLKPFGYFGHPLQVPKAVSDVIQQLDLEDLSRILFRCDQEERSDGFDVGVYELSTVGPMIYCGLQGLRNR